MVEKGIKDDGEDKVSLDFTLEKYRELCRALAECRYKILTVREYLENKDFFPEYVVLRHDVDTRPQKALRMAEVENEYGIKSVYYFRYKKGVFQPNLIKKIANLGHEIGYHYETLDKAGGNYKKAIDIFEFELKEFRKIVEIKTICMHGNPLTKWDNRHLWQKYDFSSFNLVGEAYLSVNFKDLIYFSESGRKWGNAGKIKDTIIAASPSQQSIGNHVNSTDQLIKLLKEERLAHIYVLAHPGRWNNNISSWIGQYFWDLAVNVVKKVIKIRGHLIY